MNSLIAAAGVASDQEPGGENINLSDKAYREIEEKMVMLVLRPGDIISENVLAKNLGIGRTPIREALQRLEREGLVRILPRRGVVISEINFRSQLELLPVRHAIQRLMARAAAQRCTKLESAAFAGIAERIKQIAQENDAAAFMRIEREFHALLGTACRNEYAERSLLLTQGLSRRFWYMHYRLEAVEIVHCAELLAELSSAIAARKAEEAAAASDRLIGHMEEFARASLGISP